MYKSHTRSWRAVFSWIQRCTTADAPPMLCAIYSFRWIPLKTCTRTKVSANIYPLHCVESMTGFFTVPNIKLLSILSSSLRNKDCEFPMNCSRIESVYSHVNAEPSCQTSRFSFCTQYSREREYNLSPFTHLLCCFWNASKWMWLILYEGEIMHPSTLIQ